MTETTRDFTPDVQSADVEEDDPMQDALSVYFDGEKYAGLLLAGIGAAVMAAAAIMLRARLDLRSFALVTQKTRPGVTGVALGLLISADFKWGEPCQARHTRTRRVRATSAEIRA